MKICMFFGTSILRWFWDGFAMVLGGQNPRFSHFFQGFFDVIFKARFERRKKRPSAKNGANMAPNNLRISERVAGPTPSCRLVQHIKTGY